MFFFKKKTVGELRRQRGLTARELADRVRCRESLIRSIDGRILQQVPQPLRGRLESALRGDEVDKIPW
jgi:ribosome-binding protein aMBF1 (putative translation factor)